MIIHLFDIGIIFQHVLVEIEAENIRSKVKSAGPLMRNLMEEINDTIQRLGKNMFISHKTFIIFSKFLKMLCY